MMYGVLRFLVEVLRDQNGVYFWGLSEGQWLTIPLFIIGVILWVKTANRHQESH
jgi:prolipoprotein diacylglyceryltransferase